MRRSCAPIDRRHKASAAGGSSSRRTSRSRCFHRASAKEVPANATTGLGPFSATLDTSTGVLTYDLTFSGLTSNVNNGHIHGPAAAGVNSNTTINFNTRASATLSFGQTAGAAHGTRHAARGTRHTAHGTRHTAHGTVTLNANTQITTTINDDAQKKLLFAGFRYANIHMVTNAGGQIRGQVANQ